jgi:hypothetical protein
MHALAHLMQAKEKAKAAARADAAGTAPGPAASAKGGAVAWLSALGGSAKVDKTAAEEAEESAAAMYSSCSRNSLRLQAACRHWFPPTANVSLCVCHWYWRRWEWLQYFSVLLPVELLHDALSEGGLHYMPFWYRAVLHSLRCCVCTACATACARPACAPLLVLPVVRVLPC